MESARALLVEDEVAVGLVTIRFLRAGRNIDHALPDRAALAFERTLEQQVAGGVGRKMVLLGIMVEMLVAICKVKARHSYHSNPDQPSPVL